nr:MAG TPA: nucleoside triphosphate pyrophosphohydrolase [Caudoviricetes sp.]
MCTYMRARKYSIYIKSLEGVSGRIRFQGQKSTRKGDTEMALNDSKRFHFLMHEIDARINNETMDRYGIKMQSLVAMEELAELQKAISKLVRNSEEKTKSLEFKGLRHNLIEEMADVIICMDQLKEYYNINHAEIQSIIASKQARQAKRLEEE